MSEFVKPKETTIPTDEWMAVHQLAKRYLEMTDMGTALEAQERLHEAAEQAKQQGLISKLEIWQVQPLKIVGAWYLVNHNEETAEKVEAIQVAIEAQYQHIEFTLHWYKSRSLLT